MSECFFCKKTDPEVFLFEMTCCNSSYCYDCISAHLETQLSKNNFRYFICFSATCVYWVKLGDFLENLNNKYLMKLYRNYRYKNSGSFRYCKTCKYVFPHSSNNRCTRCYERICEICCLSHVSSSNCSMKEVSKLIENFNLISCPVCNFAFEKDGGCNSIRCKQCGVKYCGNCNDTDYYIRKRGKHHCYDYGTFQSRYNYEPALGEDINPSSDED